MRRNLKVIKNLKEQEEGIYLKTEYNDSCDTWISKVERSQIQYNRLMTRNKHQLSSCCL